MLHSAVSQAARAPQEHKLMRLLNAALRRHVRASLPVLKQRGHQGTPMTIPGRQGAPPPVKFKTIEHHTRKTSILIVDDDPGLREALVRSALVVRGI